MDPSTSSGYTQLPQTPKRNPTQAPKAYPNATTRVNMKPNAAMELEDQHEKPLEPPLIELSYRAISIVRSANHLSYIIAANCLCSACICLCLWGFSKIDDLTVWEKRAFNALSLLLSAVLSFGVGFLFDRIGVLARGTVLQSKPHSVEGVGYIIEGTPLSYTALFMHEIRTRRGLVASGTLMLFLFLLCSLLGRFGIAFLGLAFNLDDSPHFTPPLFRPDWKNGTLSKDSSVLTDLASELGIPPRDIGVPFGLKVGILFQMAQTIKGLPWFFPRFSNLPHAQIMSYAMDISHFSNENLTMEVTTGNTVSYKYKFRDFLGTAEMPAGRDALLKTSCQEFITSPNQNITSQGRLIPLTTSNFKEYPLDIATNYRWIFPMNTVGKTVQMWLVGQSKNSQGMHSLAIEHSYVPKQTIAFNCTVDIDSDAIAQDMNDYLSRSLALPRNPNSTTSEVFRDFNSTIEFDFGVSRQNRSASATWLSAYTGNYIGNCLSYLNELLWRIKIEAAQQDVTTKLLVKWRRVAVTLVSLAVLQMLFGLAGLFYCRQGFELVFPPEPERRQESRIHQGKVVPAGNGVHWVFVTGEGKGIQK
ncbi:hypothetical protein L211DRAFT_864775 [Terfezia boudieri ATCC MYA-4762]|uniref:Uncharacterized protein n=1 Tax=Terfezia boudieri ATCC MYA-4762 TaxID=1051890 RepID=A0A3N4MMI5_9PEZI|nr:hypothetical protein L211DRAFT_864775 [Terfezia boudieri ATCC MYA-4762]